MNEAEIISSLEYYVKRTPMATDSRSLETNTSYAIQGILDLYKKEKENNTELRIQISARETVVEELQEKIEEIRDKAEVMDYYTLNDVIEDLTKLLGE